jgi:hypothetical protein
MSIGLFDSILSQFGSQQAQTVPFTSFKDFVEGQTHQFWDDADIIDLHAKVLGRKCALVMPDDSAWESPSPTVVRFGSLYFWIFTNKWCYTTDDGASYMELFSTDNPIFWRFAYHVTVTA